MNYYELTERLKVVSPDSYEFEAEILLEAFTDKKIAYIRSHRDEEIGSNELTLALERRERREPLQYIVGKWEFYRQEYYVDENCLIPRSDTEVLVEKAIDLLPQNLQSDKLFPCGRLDKNTLGLMLITDNGDLAHELLSPKSHVTKSYRFKAAEPISTEDAKRFEEGVTLADGYVTMPAKIELLGNRDEGIITLKEGKYHQIKRMLGALDNKIIYLERITFGPLTLDKSLARGEWRFLTDEEIENLKQHKKKFGGV